jgi:pyridoxine 5'-phosphate synthase PdxJ
LKAPKKQEPTGLKLYTESYASHFHADKKAALNPYITAATKANELGLGINAGHDLNLHNLNTSLKIFQVYLKFLLATHWFVMLFILVMKMQYRCTSVS